MSLTSEEIEPDKLLLDPNNYRFQDADGFVVAADDRFHEASVQTRAYERLKKDIIDLKKSISRSGFIPVDRIVVRPYSTDPERYVIVEGNRRVASVKWVLEDHAAGVAIDAAILSSLEKLPVIIVEEAGPDEAFRASLMGIRHVSGIKEWGGYQRAKLMFGCETILLLTLPTSPSDWPSVSKR